MVIHQFEIGFFQGGNKLPVTKIVNLKDILVNLNNPRFEEQPDEESEIIKILLDKNRTFELMKDITKNGLDPSELPILTFNDELGKYIVMEGNRRITALKVLNDPKNVPSAIKEREKILSRIKKIVTTNKFEEINKVQCVIYQGNDPLLKHFIELKHTGERKGAGRVRWDTESKTRFDASDTFRIYLINFLKNVHPQVKDSFGLTTFERIISDQVMRVAIGIIVDRKKPEIKFVDNFSKLKLYFILDGLISKIFKVKDFYSKENREYFANKYLLDPANQPWRKSQNNIPTSSHGDTDRPTALSHENSGNSPTPSQGNTGSSSTAPSHENPGSSPTPSQGNTGRSSSAPSHESPGSSPTPSQGNTGRSSSAPSHENPGSSPTPSQGNTGSSTAPSHENTGSSKGNGGRPYKDISEYVYLLKAIPFKNHFRKNERINKTVQELSKVEYKELPISSMYLIRSLLETYVNEYIEFFAGLDRTNIYKMKNINPNREKRNKPLRDLIYSDIYIHLKDVIKSYSETYNLINIAFSENNNTSAMQIINFHIHSNKHYPDKNEILEAWKKISTLVITLDTLLAEYNGQ
jgi:hypothetical protein